MVNAGLKTGGFGDRWNVFGEKIISRVQGSETLGRFTVIEEISPPDGVVPEHFHKGTDEFVYVLEGRYEFRIGGIITVAEPGDVLAIPRNTPHGFRNVSEHNSRLLAIITPSGFERFFAEVDELSEFDPARVAEIGKRNDLELAG